MPVTIICIFPICTRFFSISDFQASYLFIRPHYQHIWFELYIELHKSDPFKHFFYPNMKVIHVSLNEMLRPDICGGSGGSPPEKKENLASKISLLNNFGLKFSLFIIL